MKEHLPYNPGSLPTRSAPNLGEEIHIIQSGLPPCKRRGSSLRNPSHPRYNAFVALRNAATKAMDGRAWYFGPVSINLVIYCNQDTERWGLNEYLDGIMDTLDGSSGIHFTYLPIVFEDDSQVSEAKTSYSKSKNESYDLKIVFL